MVVTPTASVGTPAPLGGAAPKGEANVADQAFAALLAMLVVQPAPMVLPTQAEAQPAAQAPATPAVNLTPQSPAAALPPGVAQLLAQLTVAQAQSPVSPVSPVSGAPSPQGTAGTQSPLPVQVSPELLKWIQASTTAQPGQTPAQPGTADLVLPPDLLARLAQKVPAQALPVRQAPVAAEPAQPVAAAMPAQAQAQAPLAQVILQPATQTPPRGDERREDKSGKLEEIQSMPDTARASALQNAQAFRLSEGTPVDHPAPIQSPIDVGRFMDAVAQSAKEAPPGHYTVSLQLWPANLGEVHLQMHISGQEVRTILQVVNPEAKQILEVQGDQLRQSLGQAGLTLSGFEVSTGGGQSRNDRNQQMEEALSGRKRFRPTAIRSVTGAGGARQVQATRNQAGRLDTLA